MACASFAAQSGAKVLVVEKQSTVGGSSNYSAGMLYVSTTIGAPQLLTTPAGARSHTRNSDRGYQMAIQNCSAPGWTTTYQQCNGCARTRYLRRLALMES